MFALNSVTAAAISRELDVCALRHETYSTNIANADVQGYERLDVARQATMESAFSSGMAEAAADSTLGQLVNTHESVKLDQEMAKLSKNALRYETLLTAYQQTTGILNLAIKDGRGG